MYHAGALRATRVMTLTLLILKASAGVIYRRRPSALNHDPQLRALAWSLEGVMASAKGCERSASLQRSTQYEKDGQIMLDNPSWSPGGLDVTRCCGNGIEASQGLSRSACAVQPSADMCRRWCKAPDAIRSMPRHPRLHKSKNPACNFGVWLLAFACGLWSGLII